MRMSRQCLKNLLPNPSKKSGCITHYTNHSLWATAITRLFNSGVLEKVIAERSGHKNLTTLRVYQHTSVEQKIATSKILSSPETLFEDAKKEKIASIPAISGFGAGTIKGGSGQVVSGNFSNYTINSSCN